MSPLRRLELSHDALDLAFSLEGGLSPERWSCPSRDPMIDSSSPLFSVLADGRVFDAQSPNATVSAAEIVTEDIDARHAIIGVSVLDADLEADLHIVAYPETALIEQWITIRNSGVGTKRVDRLDSFSLHLPSGDYELLSFSSAWGAEFEGMRRPLDEAIVLQSRSGRSSNGMH